MLKQSSIDSLPGKVPHLIIGAGIAGLVCALELAKAGEPVLIIDAAGAERVGGQARIAFGGMCLVDTPEQRRLGLADSPELCFADWQRVGRLKEGSYARAWAEYYCEHSRTQVYDYLVALGLKFLPAVQWVERGWHIKGNSLPRYHVLWGCSKALIEALLVAIERAPGRVDIMHNTRLVDFESAGSPFVVQWQQGQRRGTTTSEQLYLATGGFSGRLDKVKRHWPEHWPPAPQSLLSGTLAENDGHLHDLAWQKGLSLTNQDAMWNYAAGIGCKNPLHENYGLSLIPAKSALWLDATGQRIGPEPLVTGFDTQWLCQRLAGLAQPHSWQIMNTDIVARELAVSGNEYNDAIREKSPLALLKEVLLGNRRLLERLQNDSDDVVVATTLEELVAKMQTLDSGWLQPDRVYESVRGYDAMLRLGKKLWNDEQIRRLWQLRNWRSERLRTCQPAPIENGSKLVAIRLRLISRKCLGGIETDLSSRVIDRRGLAIDGLYAMGELAGFGGGGANGKSSLEGTFLAGAILTAKAAARNSMAAVKG